MGISPTQLIIVLVIVALVFGTKKLRNMGGDIGGAVKGFKKAMSSEDDKNIMLNKENSSVLDGEVESVATVKERA